MDYTGHYLRQGYTRLQVLVYMFYSCFNHHLLLVTLFGILEVIRSP